MSPNQDRCPHKVNRAVLIPSTGRRRAHWRYVLVWCVLPAGHVEDCRGATD